MTKRDIFKFLEPKAMQVLDTGIGSVSVFSSKNGFERDVLEIYNKQLIKCDALELIRSLVVTSCFPIDSLFESKYMPEHSVFSLEDAESLSNQELESIAKIYIEHKPELYKNSDYVKETTDDGRVVNTKKYNDILYPQMTNEFFSSYLLRLSIIELKKENERRLSLEESIFPLTSFSPQLNQHVTDNLLLGGNLFESSQHNSDERISHPLINVEQPIDILSYKLDQLIDLSKESTEFIVDSNSVHIGIASELKANGVQTSSYSKWSLRVSIFVLILTVLSLYFNWEGVTFSDDQNAYFDHFANEILSAVNTKDEINRLTIENEKYKDEVQVLTQKVTILEGKLNKNIE